MLNKLDQLKAYTVIVADTGDVGAVARLRPEDCTTNPSLVLKAVQDPRFEPHLKAALAAGAATTEDIADHLTITIGAELAALVPGRVSTEVDARLSFDTQASFARARAIIDAYENRGVGRERVLIKLAATWEGIEAARRLQDEGIDCNLTLVFSLAQAAVCADAGVFLISPFVGRITDWHSKATGRVYSAEEDPGVASVRRIYAYYKARNIPTIVMGASFRTTGQIAALAGCDRLTISPTLLDALQAEDGDLARALPEAGGADIETVAVDEGSFRWMMNEDAMATEKLAEGIRNFHADAVRLHELIARLQGDGH